MITTKTVFSHLDTSNSHYNLPLHKFWITKQLLSIDELAFYCALLQNFKCFSYQW